MSLKKRFGAGSGAGIYDLSTTRLIRCLKVGSRLGIHPYVIATHSHPCRACQFNVAYEPSPHMLASQYDRLSQIAKHDKNHIFVLFRCMTKLQAH
jgi:hypothetical protein